MALVDPWGNDSDSESTLSTGGWVAPREDIERYRGESTVVPQATLSQNTQGKVNDGSTNNPLVSLAGGGSVPDIDARLAAELTSASGVGIERVGKPLECQTSKPIAVILEASHCEGRL